MIAFTYRIELLFCPDTARHAKNCSKTGAIRLGWAAVANCSAVCALLLSIQTKACLALYFNQANYRLLRRVMNVAPS
jgi:hypothetical protein